MSKWIEWIEEFISCDGWCKFCAQEEIGDLGNYHIQGYLEWGKPIRLSEHKAKWARLMTEEGCHTEMRKKTRDQCIWYCTRADKRMPDGQVWSHQIVIPVPPRAVQGYRVEDLRPWQRDMWDILKAPPVQGVNDRHVWWIHCAGGGSGKSWFARFLSRHIATLTCAGCASKDAKALCLRMIQEQKRNPEVITFDMPRTREGSVPFAAIEDFKNGFFASGKYEGGMVDIPTPHVVVFANFPPVKCDKFGHETLSKDRWKVLDLSFLSLNV